jgi:fatty-acyl-CoA synthase
MINVFFVVGRLDISPIEIEECLLKHSNVVEAIAFGVSINVFEQEVCAWVRLKDQHVSTKAEDLRQWCLTDATLAEYKVPRYIKIVEAFHVSNMGKYLRNSMQDSYTKELQYDLICVV